MARLHRPPLRVWVWVAATVALVVVATLLWRGSDAAATESTTAEPAGVPVGAPAAAVSEAWSATGDPMPEDVVESGRVLIGSEHGVRALDPRTGEESWHYTRSNARLCDVAVTDGVAVAVFRTEDRCDEAVALDADTGVRAWTRNVSFGGDVVLDSTSSIVLATAERSLVTLDPNNNNIRWRYEPPERCRILGADAGDAGVALLQRCSGSPAVQLRMLDGFTGDARWSRDLPAPDRRRRPAARRRPGRRRRGRRPTSSCSPGPTAPRCAPCRHRRRRADDVGRRGRAAARRRHAARVRAGGRGSCGRSPRAACPGPRSCTSRATRRAC